MTTLTRSRTKPSVYRINSPAHAAHLTRTGGMASNKLCNRIYDALSLDDHAQLQFKRGASGKWYVRIGERS